MCKGKGRLTISSADNSNSPTGGMDKQTDSQTPRDPFAMVSEIKTQGPAPVHLWDPPYCGDIDLVIRRDGTWVHEGRPIRRPAMVRLFASILKREADGRIYLVTPVEKVGITVEDCPFLVVDMVVENPGISQTVLFTTNTDETVCLDQDHPLKIDTVDDSNEPHPVLMVRNGLQGLLTRAVFYRLAELAQSNTGESGELGIRSAGTFFKLA